MREIKFRIWDRGNGQMIPWSEFEAISNEGGYSLISSSSPDTVLMQYTGLKDKNGKDIYEGDIVRGTDANNATTKGQVAFVSGGFRLQALHLPQFRQLEVIGNIYENPELLASLA